VSTLEFSPLAEADLAEIIERIAQDDPAAARRLLGRFRRLSRQIVRFPDAWPTAPEIAPHARFAVVGNYVVLFRRASHRVKIVRVLHGARDIAALLRRDDM
jgi:toxin ParE1/3/4